MRKLAVGQALLIASMVMVAIPLLVLADDAPGGPGQPDQLGPNVPPLAKPAYPRLDSQLNRMVEYIGQMAPQGIAGQAPMYQGSSVAVTIRLSGNIPSALQFLEQGGAVAANVGPDYIEAYVPVALLIALAGRADVLRVETIIPPQPAVASQGTTVHGSPVWNTAGYTGAGVKVGVIDVGFIGYNGLMGIELPSTVIARCYTAVGVFSSTLADCETDTVHGTAVAEAVVDIAPAVALYIANPISGSDLQAAASWMLSQGVDVINHSVGWTWTGPGDGTSPFSNDPLGAVDIAVAGGTIWVNAAGNDAQQTWRGTFSDSDINGFHNFFGVDETNNITLAAGQTILVQLRWNDSWTAALIDLELLLLDAALLPVASSVDPQSGQPSHVPHEVIVYTAPASGTSHIAVEKFAGTVPSWLQVQVWKSPLEYTTTSNTIANPAESSNPGMLAVGAARWSSTSTIESFSSQGPTTDGRTKPDIVGADGGESVSYGPVGSLEPTRHRPMWLDWPLCCCSASPPSRPPRWRTI